MRNGILEALLDESVAGIRYSRHACIGNDGETFSAASHGDEFGDAALFVMLMEGDQWLVNAVMLQER